MSAPRRSPRRRVDGVLLLDKPLGMTSNAALQAVRRLFNAEKAGHTGTLDPLASGLLPLCFGEATKFSAELLDADKSYEAVARLGIRTDTADAEGKVIDERPVNAAREQVEAVLASFVGEIEQVPPMHSALKRDGKPLYAYARAGIDVERPPRRVAIHELHFEDMSGDCIRFSVRCSKGTYIRTLAEDIGLRLGCGAHLSALRRTRIGRLDAALAVSLDVLASLDGTGRDARLLPIDTLLGEFEEFSADAGEARRLTHGQPVARRGIAGQRLRIRGPSGEFLGVGTQRDPAWLWPQRMVAAAGCQQLDNGTAVPL